MHGGEHGIEVSAPRLALSPLPPASRGANHDPPSPPPKYKKTSETRRSVPTALTTWILHPLHHESHSPYITAQCPFTREKKPAESALILPPNLLSLTVCLVPTPPFSLAHPHIPRDEALHGQILALSLDLPKSRRPPPRPPPTAPGSRLLREVRDTDASRSLLDLLLSHPRPRKADKAFPASPRVHTPSGGDGETRGKARARQLRRLKTSAPFLRAIGAVAGGGGADENLRAASPPAQQHFYRGMEDDGAQRRSERHGERPVSEIPPPTVLTPPALLPPGQTETLLPPISHT